jgi:O-acetylserine/cysteine efflux transporter
VGVGDVLTRAARPPDALVLLVRSSLVPSLPLHTLSLAFEGAAADERALTDASAAGNAALLSVVGLATAFGFCAWTWLLHRHAASRVAPFARPVPVVGTAAAWLALGDRPNAAELAGAAVVVAGAPRPSAAG